MKSYHDKISELLADPAALEAAFNQEFRYYEPAERDARFDRFDLFARMFMRHHAIESSDGDWEDSTRESLAAGMRAVAGVPPKAPRTRHEEPPEELIVFPPNDPGVTAEDVTNVLHGIIRRPVS